MKRKRNTMLLTLVVALIGAAFAFMSQRTTQNADLVSTTKMANIEALTGNEETEVVITCSSGRDGQCFRTCWCKGMKMCGEYMYYPCCFSGYQDDYCSSPC
jgi:hypothetical protein